MLTGHDQLTGHNFLYNFVTVLCVQSIIRLKCTALEYTTAKHSLDYSKQSLRFRTKLYVNFSKVVHEDIPVAGFFIDINCISLLSQI